MPASALAPTGEVAFRYKVTARELVRDDRGAGKAVRDAVRPGSRYRNHGYSGRVVALVVTALVHVLITAIVIWDWRWPEQPHAVDETIVVTLLPLAPDRPVVKSERVAPAARRKPVLRTTPQPPSTVILPAWPAAPLIPEPVPEPVPEPATETVSGTDSGREGRLVQISDSYRRMISALLAKQRHFPDAALLRRHQGEAVVRFHIDRAGRLLDVAIATTTGRASLDRAALAMVKRAAPFPVIPAELPDELEIVLPVNFLVVDTDTNRVAR